MRVYVHTEMKAHTRSEQLERSFTDVDIPLVRSALWSCSQEGGTSHGVRGGFWNVLPVLFIFLDLSVGLVSLAVSRVDDSVLGKYDTLVVNSGAHRRTGGIEAYGEMMKISSAILTASMDRLHGHDAILVVRNTVPGHGNPDNDDWGERYGYKSYQYSAEIGALLFP